jgi:hypothetical protein
MSPSVIGGLGGCGCLGAIGADSSRGERERNRLIFSCAKQDGRGDERKHRVRARGVAQNKGSPDTTPGLKVREESPDWTTVIAEQTKDVAKPAPSI